MAKQRKSRTGRDPGLEPRNFGRAVRWKVDQDYADKLDPEARVWLAKFNDAHYGAKFSAPPEGTEEHWTLERRREIYAAVNAARSDVYTAADATGVLEELDPRERSKEPAPPADRAATPAYLEGPDYKAARSEFRASLRNQRANREPIPSLRHERAKRALKAVTPDPPVEPKKKGGN